MIIRALVGGGRRLLLCFGVGLALLPEAGAQDGSRQWAVKIQGFITLSSPALSPDGNSVYVGVETQSGGRLVAFTKDGAFKWNVDRSEPIDASPAVGTDGTVYVGCGDGKLYAFDPDTGAIKWAYSTGSFITSSPAIGADGTIYFGAGDAKLHAVTPNGTRRWTFATGDWIDSSPAIGADGTLYFGSFDTNLYAVAPDGSERWRFGTGGRVFSSPAIGADGTIYIGSGDQSLYAIGRDGGRKWSYMANGDIQSSPTLGADGTVYFAADVTLYALRPENGAERWKTRINSTSGSSAAVRADGTVIIGADDGMVRAFSGDTGAFRWTFDTKTGPGNLIESSPIIAPDGSIYFGSFDGFLYKLNGNGSPLSIFSSWPSFHRDAQRQARAATVSGAGRLVNLSTRAQLAGGDTLIAGFVIQGAAPRAFLLRGVGPALAQFQLAGMPDPRLEVFSGAVRVGANDSWGVVESGYNDPGFSVSDTAAGVGAFPLPAGSRDAALVLPLASGLFTSHVSSTDGRGGVVLVEAYDAVGGDPSARLVNLSTRGQVGVGDNALFAGVVVGGTGRSRLLLRAVGPGLTQFGVAGVLDRPTLSLFTPVAGGGQRLIRSNAGWSTENLTYDFAAAARAVAAFPLQEGSADCAMVVTVEPGNYTLQVSGLNGQTGEALVEVYVLP